MRLKAIYKASRSSEHGFTLIEALIAVSLLSLLSLLVIGALRFGISAWQRSQDATMNFDQIVHAQNFLHRIIANAHPHFVRASGGKGYVDFEGLPQSMTLLSDPPASLNRAGRLKLSVQARLKDGHDDLIIVTRPELAQGKGSLANDTRSLVDNIESAKFSYFGSKGHDRSAQWHSQWGKEAALPELIRFDLVLRPDRQWPPIFIRPRIEIDISCIYDPLTDRCRGR